MTDHRLNPRAWMSRQYREHPWLTALVCLYLLLSGVELARNLALADPLDRHDVGFSAWEEVPVPGSERNMVLLRWSEPRSAMLRPVEGTVLSLLLVQSRGEQEAGELPITLSIDGQPLDAYTLSANNAYSFQYYLPPILGPGFWSEVEARLAERARTEAEAEAGGWLANWKELKPWRRLPQRPSIWIETAVGSRAGTSASSDSSLTERHLPTGLGIATVEWRNEVPADGIGFHAWETDAEGVEYRWTRRWASLGLQATGSEALVTIRAIHPNIERQPVAVDFFWNGKLRRTVSLSDREWTQVAVAPQRGTDPDGVLSIRVARTWSPATAGVSPDGRELGVAVAGTTWR